MALEQLCRNVHLHNQNFHFIRMLRLMTSRWRKQLLKVSDLCITMPFDSIVWPASNFEPLSIAIVYLSLVFIPGSFKTQSLLVDVRGICRKCGKTISFWGGIFCGNFCNQRGHWKACRGIWCGKCYHSAEIDNYRIVKTTGGGWF